MRRTGLLIEIAIAGLAAVVLVDLGWWRAPAPSFAQSGRTLQPVSAFSAIADTSARSRAFFVEAGQVLQHPRCVNCHPATDRPLQGEQGQRHRQGVRRGADGHGVPGMWCSTCHGAANYDVVGMPGHPNWHLAPASMAWEGKSLGQICTQIKDPARNGGHSLAEIVHHMAQDSLVGWAWAPGRGRVPAPGSQAAFGALIRAWADTGAVCTDP
jgi:hypothetical protein